MNILIFLICIILAKLAKSQPTPLTFRISINPTEENIYLRLENNQILFGNRYLLNYKWANGSIETRIVYEFLSLPFAEAPIGDKRFKLAFKLNKTLSSDIYNGTIYRTACAQPNSMQSRSRYNEDCLYFNIWVPVSKDQDDLLYFNQSKLYAPNNLNGLKYINNGFLFSKTNAIGEKKTSMFWIHGGAFILGSSNKEVYDGGILASTENVIVASTNYRLGVFGFLYLNDSRVADNIGLTDQIAAIEWFKEKYLGYFGGSHDSLCLFGESAGAMSIRALMLSKKNYLFNRVILQSPFNISYMSPGEAFELSVNYLKRTGCLASNFDAKANALPNSYFECLTKANATFLLEKQADMVIFPTSSFVDEKQSLKMDMLVGINQNENSPFLLQAFGGTLIGPTEQDLNNIEPLDATKYDNRFAADRVIEFFKNFGSTLSLDYLNCVNNLYTLKNSVFLNDYNNASVDYNLDTLENRKLNSRRMAWDKIKKITSDMNYNCASFEYKAGTKTSGKTYQYKFNKRASFGSSPRWFGVGHADEIPFVLGVPLALNRSDFSDPLDQSERFISALTMNYWANFAKTGMLYSKYDIKNRSTFLEISDYVAGLTEAEEYRQFLNLHRNCDLIKACTNSANPFKYTKLDTIIFGFFILNLCFRLFIIM